MEIVSIISCKKENLRANSYPPLLSVIYVKKIPVTLFLNHILLNGTNIF